MALISKPIFGVDIVDFSLRPSSNQMKLINKFIEMLNDSIPEEQNNPCARIWSPAGDGGCLTFWEDIHACLETAISLSKLVNKYNSEAEDDRPLQLRMGLHVGPVTKEKDFDGRENIWGDGINMATRVVSLAKPGQILASEDFFKNAELSTHLKEKVASIGKGWIKHDHSIIVYNIHIDEADGVGIPHSEVQDWLDPFSHPLELAIKTYEVMVEEAVKEGTQAFRAAVLSKRLLDLVPRHKRAKEIIQSISEERFLPKPGSGELYDAFFSPLSPNALLYFFQNARFKTFERHEFVYRADEDADSMMVIVSGKITPYVERRRIAMPDLENNECREPLVLKEGDIVGEMGLFTPGERRTADLIASERSITLSLEYRLISPAKNHEIRKEIIERIWKYYCKRAKQNQINAHPLFQSLSCDSKNQLLDTSTILPEHPDDSVKVENRELWNNWIIVIDGTISLDIAVKTDKEKVDIMEKGALLGPVRLVTQKQTYKNATVSDNAHLLLLPWDIIEKLLKTEVSFRNTCMVEAGKARESLGLTF